MRAGTLDQRVSLWRLSGGFDELGQPLPDEWTLVGTVWACVQPLRGREYIAAQAALSEITTKVTMRHRPGVTPDLKVTHEGRDYQIQSVIDPDSAGRELHLMCKAVG